MELSIGMAATFLSYTDRNPGTVTKIFTDKKILVDTCDWKVVGGPYEYGEDKEYEYQSRPIIKGKENGQIYTLRKNGNWILQGYDLLDGPKVELGYRRRYQDPSF